MEFHFATDSSLLFSSFGENVFVIASCCCPAVYEFQSRHDGYDVIVSCFCDAFLVPGLSYKTRSYPHQLYKFYITTFFFFFSLSFFPLSRNHSGNISKVDLIVPCPGAIWTITRLSKNEERKGEEREREKENDISCEWKELSSNIYKWFFFHTWNLILSS